MFYKTYICNNLYLTPTLNCLDILSSSTCLTNTDSGIILKIKQKLALESESFGSESDLRNYFLHFLSCYR